MRQDHSHRRGGNRRGHHHHRGPNSAEQRHYQDRDRPSNDHSPKDDNHQGGRHFKKKFIRRDRDDQGQRNERGDYKHGGRRDRGKKVERDLDRELRDYWITHKGDANGEGN